MNENWTSVRERLPEFERYGYLLYSSDDGIQRVGYRIGSEFYIGGLNASDHVPVPWGPVTHWRPLPAPPAASGDWAQRMAHEIAEDADKDPPTRTIHSNEQPKETRYVCRGCGTAFKTNRDLVHEEDMLWHLVRRDEHSFRRCGPVEPVEPEGEAKP